MGTDRSGGRSDGGDPSVPLATASPEWQTRLRATLDALPDLLFVLDRHGTVLDYHAPNRIGLFVPPEQFLGRNAADVLPGPAADVVRRAIAEALATGHHEGGTYALDLPPDERWFELSIAAHGDLNSDDARLVAIAREVTGRKRAEDALREREQTYRMLTEGMQDVIWVLDVEARRFTYVSPSVEKLRGYTPAEILARPLEDAWVPAERDKLEQFVRQSVAAFLAGQITSDTYVTYEMLQPCKDGAVVASEVVARLVRNERTGRLEAHGVTRNISRRVQAENSLRESETRFNNVAQTSRSYAWEVDADGLLTYVSPVVEDVLGYRPEEIVGHMHFYDFYPAENAEQAKAASVRVFRDAQPISGFENPNRTKDGRVVWVSSSAMPLFRADGSLRGYQGVDIDVTARKQAEEALRESESRFAQLARQSRTIVFEMDADGRGTFVSPEVEDVLGYRPEDVVGKLYFYDLFSPGDRAAFKAAAFEVFRKKAPLLDFENPCVTRDGRKIWVSTNALPVLHPDGTLRGYRGSVRDVTDRKHAEDALRESEARFAQTARQSRAFVWEIDADGLYMFVTPVVEDVLGYRPDEIAGRLHFYDLHPEQGRAAFKAAAFAVVRRHGEFRDVENPMVAKDGRTIWVSTNAIPLRDENGALLGYRGVDLDVTERKQAQDALRESEARFAAVIQASRAFVWEVAPDGLYTHVGGMVAEVLGYRPEDLVGRRHFYDLLPPDGREELKRHCLGIMARRESSSGFETVEVAKDGRLVWVSSSARPLFDADGTYRGYQGIDTDISARKQAEEALRESELRLRALNDNLPGGLVYQMDSGVDGRERRLLAVSKGVERMHGVTVEEALSHQKTFYLQVVPEDQARVAELEARAIATLTPFRAEVRCRMPAGEIKWIYVSSAPRRLPNGHVVWDGIELDVTDRKLAEEALKTSETRYRELFDFAVDGILLGSPDGVITDANACMCALAGRPRRELVGLHITQLFDPQTMDETPMRFDLVHQGETVTRVRKLVRPDASEVFVEIHSKMMPDGAYQSIYHDITQRKQAEKALQQSEAKYRQLHESMRDPFASTDLKGNFLDFNPAFVDLLGYSRDELLGLNFRDVTPRKWHAQEKKIVVEQVRKRGYSAVYEKEYVRKDGAVVPVELRTMLVCDAGGNPTGLSAFIRDISERRRSEQALRESEAKYRRLLEWMRDAFVLADLEGRLVECNPAFEALVGYRKDELARLRYADITPAKWRSVDARAVQQVLRHGNSGVTEKEYIRKDGSVVPVEMSGTLIRDAAGKPLGISAIVRDISERKRTEQALRQAHDGLERRVQKRTAELVVSQQALAQSEEQFRQMAESIQEVFWLVEARTGRALYVSPAFESIWGRSRETLENGFAAWLATLHPDDRGGVQRDFARGVRTGTFSPLEYRILWPDGTVRWIRDSAWGVRDRRGRVVRVAGVFRDITEQRRLESEILQAAETERQRIGRDLHDSLGQSLTAIGYLADAIREDLARAKRSEAAEVQKLGRLIGQTAAEAHALARGLLLADVTRGGLAAAVQELAFRTQELFGVACRYTGPARVPPLDASVAAQLYRIAQEAITNAAKHGQAPRIDVRLAKKRGELLLSVRDTGRGIPARKQKDFGLGLDIMRYRASLIGAKLEIDSGHKQGTTVKCLLPLAAPASPRKK